MHETLEGAHSGLPVRLFQQTVYRLPDQRGLGHTQHPCALRERPLLFGFDDYLLAHHASHDDTCLLTTSCRHLTDTQKVTQTHYTPMIPKQPEGPRRKRGEVRRDKPMSDLAPGGTPGLAPYASVANTSPAASMNASISSSVCASETKHASNWLGASQ